MDVSKPRTFGYDLDRLSEVEGLHVLKSGESMLAVSGILQGRVFTSSSAGNEGQSYGWFNSKLIEDKAYDTAQAGMGGEGRLWFGPEWGPHNISFDPGKDQTQDNFRRPEALQKAKFEVLAQSETSVSTRGELSIRNVDDFLFELEVHRSIDILDQSEIEENLGIKLKGAQSVGFSVETEMTNIGENWNRETGLLSLWELGCMNRAEGNVVILPLSKPATADSISAYFTDADPILRFKENVAFYRADANYFNKVGVRKEFSIDRMGSYDPVRKVLSIVTFTFDPDQTLFVNSTPDNTDPYNGDVTNIFNGGVVPGKDIDLPFFEFESSSHARELEKGESLSHTQKTYHFEGSLEALSGISKTVLGASLEGLPELY
ncbi:MAG: DUF6786 family protein [Bacteroidota bacterium]